MRGVLQGTRRGCGGVRRRRAVEPGHTPFTWTSWIGVMLRPTIALTPVSSWRVVHLLLPWPAVRWAVLGLSSPALVGSDAFASALCQRPRTLDPDRLTALRVPPGGGPPGR